ncbi:MAG TPA: HAD family phosphatase [Casimicrobiaceae bacterium]|nr:HAD family phosphatase [Casimicrobiaceae bacterium]
MIANRPQAVIFDMDGLMLDTEPLAARAWTDAANACGIPFDKAVTTRLIGRTFVDCRALILDHHGSNYPVDQLMNGWGVAYDALVEREGVAVKRGLVELLDWLEAAAIDKAVATSTRRERACRKLENAGVLHRFSAIAGGDEVEHGKPAPDLFLLAAERLAVAPAECLVLEDSPAGLTAAHRAGMHAIGVPDLCKLPATIEEKRLIAMASLIDVRDFLESLPTRSPMQ